MDIVIVYMLSIKNNVYIVCDCKEKYTLCNVNI